MTNPIDPQLTAAVVSAGAAVVQAVGAVGAIIAAVVLASQANERARKSEEESVRRAEAAEAAAASRAEKAELAADYRIERAARVAEDRLIDRVCLLGSIAVANITADLANNRARWGEYRGTVFGGFEPGLLSEVTDAIDPARAEARSAPLILNLNFLRDVLSRNHIAGVTGPDYLEWQANYVAALGYAIERVESCRSEPRHPSLTTIGDNT